MNKQSKDGNISWTDYTWNPIKGLCPVGCWYCYGRAMYKRFKMNPEITFTLDDPYHISTLQNLNLKPGTKVFICSTFEIFHPTVKKEWRDMIFEIIEMNSKITFQILTKMPENIDRPMPDNVWLGCTIVGSKDILKIQDLLQIRAKVRFVSIEPFMAPIINTMDDILKYIDWVIIGRLTGHGNKFQPEIKWIGDIVRACKKTKTPIFLKNNLKEIWGGKLIQEFPE